MPRCSKPISAVAALAAAATSASAQLNGPMSSTRAPAEAASAASAPAAFDVPQLFAGTCGWCHSNAGRVAGKGPQLMGTSLTDGEIAYRIKNGKTGAMPSFRSSFGDEQIKAIIAYIRELKPEAPAP